MHEYNQYTHTLYITLNVIARFLYFFLAGWKTRQDQFIQLQEQERGISVCALHFVLSVWS